MNVAIPKAMLREALHRLRYFVLSDEHKTAGLAEIGREAIRVIVERGLNGPRRRKAVKRGK